MVILYAPQPQPCNACRLTHDWFGLFPVRSPLLRKSLVISFPPGTKMFQFPGSDLIYPIYSGSDNRGSPLLGSPIRTSTDLRLLATPPWHFAAGRVLLRLLVPRHPPYALCILTIVLRERTFL